MIVVLYHKSQRQSSVIKRSLFEPLYTKPSAYAHPSAAMVKVESQETIDSVLLAMKNASVLLANSIDQVSVSKSLCTHQ